MTVSPRGAAVYVTGISVFRGDSGKRAFSTVAYGTGSGKSLWTRRYYLPSRNPLKAGNVASSVAVSHNGQRVFVTVELEEFGQPRTRRPPVISARASRKEGQLPARRAGLQRVHAGLAFLAGPSAFSSRPRSVTSRAASALRAASARSASAPGGVSPYERRTRPLTISSRTSSTRPSTVSRSSAVYNVPVASRTRPPDNSPAR